MTAGLRSASPVSVVDLVGVGDVARLQRGAPRPTGARRSPKVMLARASRTAVDAVPADDRARQLGEDPAERADGEGEDREEVGDLDDLGGGQWPLPTRSVPTARTASVPMVGMASMAGSNVPRVRPTSMLASRSSLGHLREPLGLLVLAPQRLDDQGRLEALVGDLGDLGAQLLGAGHLRRHGALEERGWPGRASGRR